MACNSWQRKMISYFLVWCSPHNLHRRDGVASSHLLANMVSLHQLSQSGVTDGERRSPQSLAFLLHNGKADYLERVGSCSGGESPSYLHFNPW